MKHIRRALKEDKHIVEKLRISEFNRSTEFKLLKPEKLLWSAIDDANIVLVVFDDNNNAISTMMGVTVHGVEEAEEMINCSVPGIVKFPAMIFTSAATLQPFRKMGLNQLLRYYFLLYGLTTNIQTFISPVYTCAPRIKFMAMLGYQFITPERNWQTKLNPLSERQLGLLDASQISNALSIIEHYKQETLDEYPWQGEMLV
ncbi:MAG: hypothetical protein HQK70_03800 [Desulfamplus sp.]|nr:hypothetical protein [Desulfamplus sp.]